MEIHYLTAHQLKDILEKKQISCTEIVESVYLRIEEVGDRLNSYIRLEKESALSRAGEVDKLISAGSDIEDFMGMPIAIKDNICTKNITTTCASRILENYIPIYNATVIDRLESRNYILAGKANMDEFAMGSSNENSYFGTVKNPWDTDRVPGGSSGGPAVCVAAGEAVCSLGSDTGGSIRQPASLCGVVGFKPTYGMVSRYGLVAFASSLDQIGPLTRDVEDCAAMLNIICGYDRKDSTSINVEVPDYKSFLKADIKDMRIGVPKELMVEGIDREVKEAVYRIIKLVEDMGGIVEEISLPSLEYALSVYYIIAPSEASSNLSRFDGVRYGYRNVEARTLREMYRRSRAEGFGDEVKRRIMIGTYCLSAGYYDAYYEKAQRVRTLVINDFKKAFEKFDVLISPTSPTTAFKIGEKMEDPLTMYLSDICTIPVNLAGLPAISIPAGLSGSKLPIGLQIIGNVLREDNVLKVAYSLEKAIGFTGRPGL
ncbi:MAG: Asp-tRNA(Asn)/Glu-tRNA(Gln) amidotransferase subunit GatA [Chloroflexi bacterium]|nr:Asp-tRNA(Asn)/Glu-tRNA(Gln) amidotransferase subunit GatA [Chloroflexota bacterium]MBE3114123.1 Asp-tRNA(Asn)/Glu-tRNA(Gln) amidotransferase subunit GatA [Actinomycetota bacterium]